MWATRLLAAGLYLVFCRDSGLNEYITPKPSSCAVISVWEEILSGNLGIHVHGISNAEVDQRT